MCKQNQRKIKELEKQVAELKEKITALEERVRDGKNLVVIDNACDIDDIAKIVAARLNVETIIKY